MTKNSTFWIELKKMMFSISRPIFSKYIFFPEFNLSKKSMINAAKLPIPMASITGVKNDKVK